MQSYRSTENQEIGKMIGKGENLKKKIMEAEELMCHSPKQMVCLDASFINVPHDIKAVNG